MSTTPWLKQRFGGHRRRQRRKRSGSRGSAFRRLWAESLEDRRVLAGLIPAVSIDDVTVVEGDELTTDIVFTATLSESSTSEVVVDINTADGTGTRADNDFLPEGPFFREQDGMVVVEAEHFSRRQGPDCTWTLVPTELPGGFPSLFANFRGSDYVQQLPSGCGGVTPRVDEDFMEFDLVIEEIGEYRIYTRWDGEGGNSDTIYVSINEISDGPGGDIADWWELAHNPDANFATIPWDSNGGFELTEAGVGVGEPAVWPIDTPGVYTVRYQVREDVAAVDAFTFQRSNLPGPTGDGPPETALGGKLTFAPGTTSQTVTLSVVGDRVTESDETFFVNLSNPVNATIGDGQGVATVENDDHIHINDATVTEGNSGTTDAVLTVSLSQTFPSQVTVDFATAEGTGASAAGASDFVAQSGTLTFAPGETSKTITVAVTGDTDAEFDETFFVNLTNATGGAGIGDHQGQIAVTNDDGTVITWTGAGDGASWNVAANWDLNRQPDATDDLVVIPASVATTGVEVAGNKTIKRIGSEERIRIFGGTMTLTEGTSIVSEFVVGRDGFAIGGLTVDGDGLFVTDFTQRNGTVSGTGDITATRQYAWQDGTMSGTGTTFAPSGMLIDSNLTDFILQRKLETGGTTTWVDGHIRLGPGGELKNTGTIDVQGDQNFNSLGGGTVINDGTFMKTGAGTTRINRPFTNNGTVDGRAGEIAFSSNLTNYSSGTLTGGTYRTSATISVNNANITTTEANIELDGAASMFLGSFGASALANLATIQATGGLSISNGRNLSTPALNNAGSVTVGAGTMLTVNGDYTQSGGSTTVEDSAFLDPTGAVNIDGGVLQGTGTVAADVNNSATVSPGTSGGVLTINGAFSQAASGSLDIELGPTSLVPGFDRLAVSGAAALDGTLNVSSISGFVPNAGDDFQVMSYASHTGEFATENLDVGGGLVATAVLESTQVTIQVGSAAPTTRVTDVLINEARPNRSGLASLTMQLNEALTVSGPQALQLFNLTTGTPVDLSNATLQGNGTNSLTWNFANVSLDDGNYAATLPSSAGLAATRTALLHVLAGDSTGDRQVGFADFGDLATAFNTTGGPIYGPGDMDGDGDVGFSDFGVLAGGFNGTVAVPMLDFGDAAAPFPTVLPDGARHLLGSGLSLGATVDAEPDGQPDPAAAGDGADEDGVTFGTLTIGASASITVTATVPETALLNAWIDFSGDGDWDDPGEQIFADQALANGTNNLTAAIPAGVAAGQRFARFRASSVAGYSFDGLARDGEVEDYFVQVVSSLSRSAASGLPGGLLDSWAAPLAAGDHRTDQDASYRAVKPAYTGVVDLALESMTQARSTVAEPASTDPGVEADLIDQAMQDELELLSD